VGGLVDGKLPAFAWPGGYPLYYLDAEDAVLCRECASRANEYSVDTVAGDVYWEGPPMSCGHCGKEIESAYGDPEDDEEDHDNAKV